MASVQYGSVINEIRGKVNGHIFQKCGQSLSMRAIKRPALLGSLPAVAGRNSLTYLAIRWSKLSAAAKQSWIDNASSWPAFDRFGNPITLTGYQAFIKANIVMLHTGVAFAEAGAAYFDVAGYVGGFANFDLSAETFNVSLFQALPSTYYIVVYISNPLPVGSVYTPTTLFVAGVIPPETVGDYNIYTMCYNAMRYKPRVDERYFCKLLTVDAELGLWSYEASDFSFFF